MRKRLESKNIIAIGGLKCSGKDTATKMLQYLLSAPKCLRSYRWYKILKRWPSKKWETVAFAKPLKECLSIILNKPVSWFDDRDNKENIFVSLPTLKLYPKFKLHEDIRLSEAKFQKLLKTGDPIPDDYLLSIRQLMQYFGTETVRRFIGDKTWINSTLNKAESKNIIISDLRFRVELEEIKSQKGVCLYIKRDSAQPGTHSSEREVLDLLEEGKFDVIIDNNGTLEDLFNNLKSVI